MLRKVFLLFTIFGIITISVIAFTVPNDPNEIIPTISTVGFDKPLWFCIIFGGSFLYLMILWSIYDKIETKK